MLHSPVPDHHPTIIHYENRDFDVFYKNCFFDPADRQAIKQTIFFPRLLSTGKEKSNKPNVIKGNNLEDIEERRKIVSRMMKSISTFTLNSLAVVLLVLGPIVLLVLGFDSTDKIFHEIEFLLD